jgi:hypothetical protein
MLELGSITITKRSVRRKAEQDPEGDERSLCTAELAECTCPEFCERDHDRD